MPYPYKRFLKRKYTYNEMIIKINEISHKDRLATMTIYENQKSWDWFYIPLTIEQM